TKRTAIKTSTASVLNKNSAPQTTTSHASTKKNETFSPTSTRHIKYSGYEIRSVDLRSLQRTANRILNIGNSSCGRIPPFCSGLSSVDIPAPSSSCSQDSPVKGSYECDSFRIPSINGQHALHIL